jgi:uncharacterized protein YggU (UPF0235/DUF167 family)
MEKGAFSHLAQPGCELAVRVTPRAARNDMRMGDHGLRIHVTAPPEGGKANRAVIKLLARGLGIAPSRLVLLRGASGRDKVFRVD